MMSTTAALKITFGIELIELYIEETEEKRSKTLQMFGRFKNVSSDDITLYIWRKDQIPTS